MEHSTYDSYNKTRGHIRSASLENANSFIMKNTLGLPLIAPGHTGTLKSRNEQKRLRNRFGSQSNLDDYVAQSKSKFQNLRNIFETKSDYEQVNHQQQQQYNQQYVPHMNYLHNSLQHLNKMSQQPLSLPLQTLHQQIIQPPISRIEFNENLSIIETDGRHSNNQNNSAPNQNINHQSNCNNEIVDQSKHLLRPIAFKPIPFEPDYSIPNRYNELCDRYGSTPSLAPTQGPNMKFGSTSDLRHGYNSYCSNLMATSRQRCSRSLKINDSMESVRHTPDSDANSSQNSTIKSNSKFGQDQFDMTPSPSDSGISELEAALKDRDSELSYLRQTMEHNEKVIFKVHKDKEAYWENETKRLKAFYEHQQREYLLKIKKLEQMLTLQSFQFKQNKLRLSENSNRIKEQFTDLKNENDLLRSETEGLKTTERTMRDRVLQLEEKINVMDKLILNLKTQLEENEWTVCQKNGELALLKTQLKEATVELTLKEHEIVHIKTEQQGDAHNKADLNTFSTLKDNQNLEISQLNRIIILKDQVILALTNELGKLRKELSDLAIFHEYGEEPSGKYTRLKYKIENLSGICNSNSKTETETDNLANKSSLEETDLEVIINCLKSNATLSDSVDEVDMPIIANLKSEIYAKTTANNNNIPNLPDVTIKIDKQNENEFLKKQLDETKNSFEIEKLQWAEEKEKVMKYQRQLQLHYINMYQKMKELESQLSNQKF